MRVLLPLDSLEHGSQPFWEVVERLGSQIEFVIFTSREDVAKHAEGLHAESILSEVPPPTPLPGWMRPLQKTTVTRVLPDMLNEYRSHRRWRQQAEEALRRAQPDVVLLTGDYDGLGFHLCQQAHVRTVVLQITISSVNPQAYVAFWDSPSWKHHAVKILLSGLSGMFRVPMLYHMTGRAFLPHGIYFGRTLGGALGGLRYRTPIKGTYADILCANSRAYARFHQHSGIAADSIYLTGTPYMDDMVRTKAQFTLEDAACLRRELHIAPHAPVITLFTQPFTPFMLGGADYYAEVHWIAMQILDIHPEAMLILKLHPRQKAADFHTLQDEERVIMVGSDGGDDLNNQLILLSDFVINRTSTVGMNALALDVPMLTYEFYNQPVERDFRDIGGSYHVQSREAFIEALHNLLQAPAARSRIVESQRAVRDDYVLVDGRCVERIGQVLVGDTADVLTLAQVEHP